MIKALTIQSLAKMLVEYKPTLINTDNTHHIVAIKKATTLLEISPYVLYFIDSETDRKVATKILNEKAMVISVNNNEALTNKEPVANLVCIMDCDDVEKLYELVNEIIIDKQRLSNYALRLFRILTQEGSIQQVIDEAFTFSDRPLVVFDAEFKIIAANMLDEAIENEIGKRIFEKKYLDESSIVTINTNQIHKRVMASNDPILVDNPNYPNRRIIADMKIGNISVGHIVLTEIHHKFTPVDYEFIELVRDTIIQIMQKDKLLSLRKGKRYEYFFTDLLDKKINDEIQYSERLKNIEITFYDLIYVFVATLKQEDDVYNATTVLNALTQSIQGSFSFFYRDNVVIIAPRHKTNPISNSEIKIMDNECKRFDAACGMSNQFHDAHMIPLYYNQALKTIDIARSKEPIVGLFKFKDFASVFLYTQLSKEDAMAFLHPDVNKIINYDKDNSSELANTLYTFLLMERNALATSEQMHIHRNTLSYRLKKINNIIEADLNDGNVRQYLLNSFKIAFKNSD